MSESKFPPYPDFTKEWEGGWAMMTQCPKCGHKQQRGLHSSPMFFYEDCEQCGYEGELITKMRELVWNYGQLVTDKTTTREPKPTVS